jgi:hypothetical protein
MPRAEQAELRRQIADLAALKNALHHRQMLERGSPEWIAALKLEERLIGRIRAWTRPIHRKHAPDG